MDDDLDAAASSTSINADSDVDRDFDRRDFLRLRLKIFKDEYRETAHEIEQSSNQRGFQCGFRRCSKLNRRLGRARGALKALVRRSQSIDIEQLLAKIDSVLDRVRSMKTSIQEERGGDHEFDMRFADQALPKFDADDMELFLGDQLNNATDIRSVNSASPEIIDPYEDILIRLEKEADDIMISVCDALHARDICDGFLYS